MPQQSSPTIGVDFVTHDVKLPSGRQAKAQIWDTAGQERYKALTVAHYRKAVGAILIYDVTNRVTFQRMSSWLEELKAGAAPDVVVALVGNKLDLVQSGASRTVEAAEGEDFACRHGLCFFEISALTGDNVALAFDTLFQEVDRVTRTRSTDKDDCCAERRKLVADGFGASSGGCSC
eukprot:CAMPEP_0194497822 /NCGR_PEP_ID=MMETSP0253-20130528/14644_1 /TAXON_ID=2966 /ORGANISM="Noctiluca scintillans" /LENGTH=176 /DNA_ID=CAMNT_0039339371 /DNA_START=137 /DNA_END=667 /DNA_ORIENTATION=+